MIGGPEPPRRRHEEGKRGGVRIPSPGGGYRGGAGPAGYGGGAGGGGDAEIEKAIMESLKSNQMGGNTDEDLQRILEMSKQ